MCSPSIGPRVGRRHSPCEAKRRGRAADDSEGGVLVLDDVPSRDRLGSSNAACTSLTGPLGTPCRAICASHSAVGRRRRISSSFGTSTSRLRSRPAKSAKRGSLVSSGAPIASQNSSQSFCFGHAIMIQPSAVGNFWKGTIV